MLDQTPPWWPIRAETHSHFDPSLVALLDLQHPAVAKKRSKVARQRVIPAAGASALMVTRYCALLAANASGSMVAGD